MNFKILVLAFEANNSDKKIILSAVTTSSIAIQFTKCALLDIPSWYNDSNLKNLQELVKRHLLTKMQSLKTSNVQQLLNMFNSVLGDLKLRQHRVVNTQCSHLTTDPLQHSG